VHQVGFSLHKLYNIKKLDSLGNKDVKGLKVFVSCKKRLGKEYNKSFIAGVKVFEIERS
jgi:hypothetical protein